MSEENITEKTKIFGNNHHPMLVYDKISMSILAVNELAVSFYGYTSDEFLNMSFKNLIYEDDVDGLFKTLHSDISPLVHTGNWKHKKKDGSVVEVEITGSNIDFNGKFAKMVMIEEVKTKPKTGEGTELLTSIITSSDNAILSKSPDGIINSWNKSAERLYGYTAEEVIGKPVSILIPPEHSMEFSYIMNKLSSGEPIEHFETTRMKKDGSRIVVSINISPIKDDNGKVIGASSIAHDISKEKKMESESRLKEKQLLEAQHIAHLGYWEYDFVNGKLEWSEELYRIFGLDFLQRKISFKDFLLKIHPEDRPAINNKFEKAKIDFQSFEMDYRIILPEGSIKYIHGSGEVILDEHKIPVKLRGIGQDVTNIKKAELRLSARFQVTNVLVESKNLDEASPKILEIICKGTDWQIGELWLVDFDSNLLKLGSSWSVPGIPAEEFIKISKKCKFGQGVSLQGRVWESGKSSWSNNTIEDQFFPRTALAAQLRLHTALAFPIHSMNKIIGVAALYRDDSTEPDKELINMLESIGQQIGDFIERKQSEPILRETENLYKTLLEISPNAIVYTNLSGRIDFCNLQAAKLFGFSEVDEIKGQNIYAFIAKEDQKHAIENEHNIIKTGRTSNVKYSLIRQDKTKFQAELNTSIILNSDGKPKAFISIIKDFKK